MKLSRWNLGPRLSSVSWFFIELFTLITVFFLPFSKSVADSAVTVALVLWILRKFPWNEAFPKLSPHLIAYSLFLAAAALSFFQISPDLRLTALHGVLKWVQYFGIFFMGFEFFEKPTRTERLLLVFTVSLALVCINGFWQFWHGVDLVKHYTADVPGRFVRMRSTFGSPNDLAAFLLLALPPAFFFWMREKTWSPRGVARLFVFTLFGVSFLLTLSRSAFFALLVSIALYAAVRNKKILVPVLAAPLLLLASPTLWQNFFSSLNPKDITIGERLRFWETTWKMIQEHPFLGNGINTYYLKFASFAPAAETYRGYAHNCYLQLWSEVGLFGLLAFLVPFAALIPQWLFQKGAEDKEILLKHVVGVSVTAFLIQSFFDTNFFALQSAMLFWLFWALKVRLAQSGVKLLSFH